jgi:predicted dehydrogenase
LSVRIGIVGAGSSGIACAKRLAGYPDVEITAVSDVTRPTRDALTKMVGARLAVSDHRRLAADPSVDIVCVCTPPSSHKTIAVDALTAGKHVIVEPPMAITIEQADEMMEVAEKVDRRLFVAMSDRYDPVNQEMARIVEDGAIGYPYMVLGTYLENDLDRLNDWHDWLGTWDTGGGGILMQRGSELIDLLTFCLGPVEAVGAVCTRFAVQSLNKAEDTAILDLEYMEESSAQLAITGAGKFSTWPREFTGSAMRLEIYGLEGAIRITSRTPRLTTVIKGQGRKEIEESEISTDLPTDMYQDFLDSIRSGSEPLATTDQAREALRVILAGYKASQMKRRVETMENL